MSRRRGDTTRPWTGSYRPYDLVKEATIAFLAVTVIAVVLSILFSSPDDKPSTIQQWAKGDPVDFVTTATTELDGSSGTGGYGPPYNHASKGQHMAFIYPAKWFGVSHPINTVNDFVLDPLRSLVGQPVVQSAVRAYDAAPAQAQSTWTSAYEKALGNGKVGPNGAVRVAPGHYGPVPVMMNGLLGFAQAGGLDGALLTSRQFFQTDYTKSLLFLADGGALDSRAQAQHLLGDQWGMMNETGSYPGQVWLWLYTFWYQIKPFSTSANADLLVMTVMTALSLALVLIPFIPGVRSIPRWIPIYRLIWRNHYASAGPPKPAPSPEPGPIPPGAAPQAS